MVLKYSLHCMDSSVDCSAVIGLRAEVLLYGPFLILSKMHCMANQLCHSLIFATKTASRTLLDKNGIYADYTGVEKTTGAAVWGRVHAVCVNKTLYILEMCTPQVYKEQYKDTVYSRFRRTVKITR